MEALLIVLIIVGFLCSFADYGVMLEIRDLQYLPDGRSFVDCVGGRRFKVIVSSLSPCTHKYALWHGGCYLISSLTCQLQVKIILIKIDLSLPSCHGHSVFKDNFYLWTTPIYGEIPH